MWIISNNKCFFYTLKNELYKFSINKQILRKRDDTLILEVMFSGADYSIKNDLVRSFHPL